MMPKTETTTVAAATTTASSEPSRGGIPHAAAAIQYNRHMNILLNGCSRDCAENANLADLLDAAGFGGHRVAVEVNCEIVPRSHHATYTLQPGDRVEIVHAIGGG